MSEAIQGKSVSRKWLATFAVAALWLPVFLLVTLWIFVTLPDAEEIVVAVIAVAALSVGAFAGLIHRSVKVSLMAVLQSLGFVLLYFLGQCLFVE